jgi:uncharacterized membrane protein YkoI
MRKWIIAMVAVLLVAASAIGVSIALTGSGSPALAQKQPKTQETGKSEDVQEPSYTGSVKVPEPEPKDLNGLAKITADQAKEAALNSNPGTTAIKAELDNENGFLVWSVELSNGADAKVDAGDGKVLLTEQADPNEPKGESEESVEEKGNEKPDTDSIQEGNQKNDEQGEKPETTQSTTK